MTATTAPVFPGATMPAASAPVAPAGIPQPSMSAPAMPSPAPAAPAMGSFSMGTNLGGTPAPTPTPGVISGVDIPTVEPAVAPTGGVTTLGGSIGNIDDVIANL